MGIFHVIAVALGLSADSFAVATTEGVLLKSSKHAHSLRVAVVFGTCQGLMPLLGWYGGTLIYSLIQPFGNLAAFGLMAAIGAKMIFESVRGENKPAGGRGHSPGLKLWFLGVAVSLDAFAVGVSMAMVGTPVWMPALMIGLVTAITSILGVRIGDRVGQRIGRKAELAGGIILILIGLNFLL